MKQETMRDEERHFTKNSERETGDRLLLCRGGKGKTQGTKAGDRKWEIRNFLQKQSKWTGNRG